MESRPCSARRYPNRPPNTVADISPIKPASKRSPEYAPAELPIRYNTTEPTSHIRSDILPPLKVMGFLLHSTLSPSSSVAIGAGFGTFLLSSRSQSIFALPFWAYQCCPCIHPCLHAIGICSHSASFGRMREHSLLWISCHSASRLGMSHSTLDSPFRTYSRYMRDQYHLIIVESYILFAFIPRLEIVGFLLCTFVKHYAHQIKKHMCSKQWIQRVRFLKNVSSKKSEDKCKYGINLEGGVVSEMCSPK